MSVPITQKTSPSVAIVGGGPVGMALALALHQQGISAEIHDAKAAHTPLSDGRILALSQGSKQILNALGIWSKIDATPITQIHVSQQGGAGRTELTAAEEKVDALGFVASLNNITTALAEALQSTGIRYHHESRVLSALPSESHIELHCNDGDYNAQLVAYAEGRIEGETNIKSRDYDQHALICRLTPAQPHQGTAWERFTPHGPFALLPYGKDYSAVYTCTPAVAETLIALDDTALLAHLQQAFGPRVVFKAVNGRFIYPLGLRFRPSPIAPRQVWLGNAAQTLHPVAGQGFNLALRDLSSLAQSLALDRTDAGAQHTLAHYAAARRVDRRSVIGITDSLIRIFSNDHFLLRHARGAALLALDLAPPLRSFLARRMMFGSRAW